MPSPLFAPLFSPHFPLVHLRPLFLLLLQLVVRCQFSSSVHPSPASSLLPDFRDARSIVRSEGQWTRRMGEEFVRHNILPFIRQFRRQLKPPRNLQWAPGGGNLLAFNSNQPRNRDKWGADEGLMFTHVDLDPPEQRKYRKNHSSVSSLFDLGGLIVRELWKQTKNRCVSCENGRCELADPQCGFPYQLFDERVEQIYCELTLQKKKRQNPAKKAPLKAKIKCATFPPTPPLPNTLLATDYQKNWKLMCINCTFPHQSDVDTDYDNNGNGYGNTERQNNWTMPMDYNTEGYGDGPYYGTMTNDEREWADGRGGREREGWRDGRRVQEGYESGREKNDKMPKNGQMDNNLMNYPNYGAENSTNYYAAYGNAKNNKNGQNFYNGNRMGNEWQQKQRIMRVKTDKKFTLKYQINEEEGQVIATYINKARARIARGEASDLPIASGMNQIKWKALLAAEAVKQLGNSQNRAVNVLDLEVVHLIAGGYGQSGNGMTDYGMSNNNNNKELGGGEYGNKWDYEFFSGLNKNYIELKATDVLLMVVKNYLEMFMGQKGLKCDEKSCKATCKLPKRNREMAMKKEDENPSEYFCYPYELIYDHTNSIGCAVHFETKRKTELRGKLVCIMSTQHGHKKMLHHHNVFKIGSSCSNCDRSLACDAKSRLCVKRSDWHQNAPMGQGMNDTK